MPDSIKEQKIVLFFIKAPIKDQVKSRLAAIGEDHVLALYKNFILDMLEMLLLQQLVPKVLA